MLPSLTRTNTAATTTVRNPTARRMPDRKKKMRKACLFSTPFSPLTFTFLTALHLHQLASFRAMFAMAPLFSDDHRRNVHRRRKNGRRHHPMNVHHHLHPRSVHHHRWVRSHGHLRHR